MPISFPFSLKNNISLHNPITSTHIYPPQLNSDRLATTKKLLHLHPIQIPHKQPNPLNQIHMIHHTHLLIDGMDPP